MKRPAPPDRQELIKLIGGSYGQISIAEAKVVDRSPLGPGYREELVCRLSTGDEAGASFLHPAPSPGPAPAILYCHAHGNRYSIAKSELIAGRPALFAPYGETLVALGYKVFCLDMPCFGSRQHMAESATAKALLWRGETLFGRMLADLRAGLDYLIDRPDVASNDISTLGISMGGTHAWWLGALEERIAAVVQLCCFADLACLIDANAHDGHGIYMTVPGLSQMTTTGAICGLIAPRRQFIGAGLRDWSTPEPCLARGLNDVRRAYREASAEAAVTVHIERDTGHEETDAMRQGVIGFLTRGRKDPTPRSLNR